jgi:hypothetical protein
LQFLQNSRNPEINYGKNHNSSLSEFAAGVFANFKEEKSFRTHPPVFFPQFVDFFKKIVLMYLFNYFFLFLQV